MALTYAAPGRVTRAADVVRPHSAGTCVTKTITRIIAALTPSASLREKSTDLVNEDELARRRQVYEPPAIPARGYARLYATHVLQADRGCDLDFPDRGRNAAAARVD